MTGTAIALPNSSLAVTGPLGSLDAYISQVSAIPMLSREDEMALARRYRDDDDLDAARDLVMSHLRFVVHIARGYLGYGLPVGDLIQEGNVGLMKAVKRFDPDMGVRLVSFAVHWIRAEIHEYVIRNWRLVRVATTKAQRKLFFNLRSAKRGLGWLNQEQAQAIAADLKVKPEEVLQMEARMSGHDVSFSATPSDDEDGHYMPEDYLSDGSDEIADIEQAEWQDARENLMREALLSLDDRARDILQRRWLTDGEKAGLQELANEYGVSAERIRQIEAAAMKKLRKVIEVEAA